MKKELFVIIFISIVLISFISIYFSGYILDGNNKGNENMPIFIDKKEEDNENINFTDKNNELENFTDKKDIINNAGGNETISNLTYIDFTIKTDKDIYQYGEIIKIDLIICNEADFNNTVYFHGYGGDQYELGIAGVYSPTTNALSADIKSNITFRSKEIKSFHHEWNLFIYSAGGCTGPYYGDIVPPGIYEIKSSLNLDYDYNDNVELKDTKNITIENLTSKAINFNVTVIETSDSGYPLILNASKNNNTIYLNYTPHYTLSDYEIGYITGEAKIFENEFIYFLLHNNQTIDETPWYEKEEKSIEIKISILIENLPNPLIVGFYDEISDSGWGGFQPQIFEIK
jgi:hypothetical protein